MTSKIAKGTSGPAGDEHHHLVVGALDAHGGGACVKHGQSGHLVPDSIVNISDGVGREDRVAATVCGESARGRGGAQQGVVVAGTLRGAGHDASEDGSGRSTLVPDERPVAFQCHGSNVGPMGSLRAGNGNETGGVPFVAQPITIRADAMREGVAKTPSADAEGRVRLRDPGIGVQQDIAPTLDAGAAHAVFDPGVVAAPIAAEAAVYRKARRAQSAKDDETWVDGEVANTLNGFDVGERDTHAILEPAQPPTVLMENGSDVQAGGAPHIRDGHSTGVPRVYTQEVADPISANEAKTYTHEGCTFRTRNVSATANRVRRLTVLECERLQGLPDGWTRIRARYAKKKRVTRRRPEDRWERAPDGGWFLMAADGPRYRAIGNGFAIPCIRWIGERIEAAVRT